MSSSSATNCFFCAQSCTSKEVHPSDAQAKVLSLVKSGEYARANCVYRSLLHCMDDRVIGRAMAEVPHGEDDKAFHELFGEVNFFPYESSTMDECSHCRTFYHADDSVYEYLEQGNVELAWAMYDEHGVCGNDELMAELLSELHDSDCKYWHNLVDYMDEHWEGLLEHAECEKCLRIYESKRKL